MSRCCRRRLVVPHATARLSATAVVLLHLSRCLLGAEVTLQLLQPGPCNGKTLDSLCTFCFAAAELPLDGSEISLKCLLLQLLMRLCLFLGLLLLVTALLLPRTRVTRLRLAVP